MYTVFWFNKQNEFDTLPNTRNKNKTEIILKKASDAGLFIIGTYVSRDKISNRFIQKLSVLYIYGYVRIL